MSFDPENLRNSLAAMPATDSVAVALSGGVDSVALLDAVQRLRSSAAVEFRVRALHVHHGLQAAADDWQQFCEQLCASRDIPLAVLTVAVAQQAGSVEDAARNARYQAFAGALEQGEVLLLAHHLDDQLETLLLRLMRGAGPRGLAGMPRQRALGRGSLFRPLLEVGRRDLEDYARARGLSWMEDPTNQDRALDRNFCRHELLPLIESRWPNYRASWSKTGVLMQESSELLNELAGQDLAGVAAGRGTAVNLERLLALSPARQRNVLRHWLESLGIPDPGWNILQQLCREVLTAATDSRGIFQLEGVQLQRFRDELHALPELPALDNASQQYWDATSQKELALKYNGSLLASEVCGQGLDRGIARALRVAYRQGGESIRLAGRPGKTLKKILQEHQVPPWLRERLPLLYAGDELVCIPGIGVVESCAAAAQAPGISVTWKSPCGEFPG